MGEVAPDGPSFAWERKMNTWIENVLVFRGAAGFVPGRMLVSGSKIAIVDAAKADVDYPDSAFARIDGKGQYLIPGMVDCHLHGAGGYDLGQGSAEALRGIAEYELSRGVTTICPTAMTSDEATYEKIASAVAEYAETENVIAGFRMEGPMLSPKKSGSQRPEHLCLPDMSLYYKMQELSGHRLRILDVAPELAGADELIRSVSAEGTCIVSIAHTTATYEKAREAMEAGACQVTHLYNAMPAYHHREPGVIGAVFDSETCVAELIADGVHVHPAVIRAAYKVLGGERIALVSDSMMATGTKMTEAMLGDRPVEIREQAGYRAAYLPDGTLAASVTDLATCVQHAICDMQIDPVEVIRSATETPARSLGLEETIGRIEPGFDADLVWMDAGWNVTAVMKQGRIYEGKSS